MLANIKEALGMEDEQKSWEKEFDEALTCSRTTRLYGFGACFVAGWLLTIMSSFSIPSIATRPSQFAMIYVMGQLVQLSATLFLMGPCAQLKRMFDKDRIVATCIYLFFLVLTAVVAYRSRSALLTILCMIGSLVSMIWYSLSYIPYGRRMIKNCVRGCCV